MAYFRFHLERPTLFTADEDGAVTVDWVVLTALLATIGLVVMNIVRGGVYDVASDIYTSITLSVQ